MQTGELAERYAMAFMEAAMQSGAPQQAAAEVKELAQFFAGKSDLLAILKSPLVTMAVKKKIMTGIFAAKILPLTMNFMFFLIDKRRFELLVKIGHALEDLIRERDHITELSVISALPVSADESADFKKRLEKLFGGRVELSVEHDPELLCGIQIRAGDRLIDGSGLGKLIQIRAALMNC